MNPRVPLTPVSRAQKGDLKKEGNVRSLTSAIEAAVEITRLTAELEMSGQLAATNIELESLKRSRMLTLGKLHRGIAVFKHD